MHNAHAETLFFREIAAPFVIKMWDKEKKALCFITLKVSSKIYSNLPHCRDYFP